MNIKKPIKKKIKSAFDKAVEQNEALIAADPELQKAVDAIKKLRDSLEATQAIIETTKWYTTEGDV